MNTLDQFVEYLKSNDLMIAPRDLVQERLKRQSAIDLVNRKVFASFKELSDAQVFGKISPQGVKTFLMKYASEDDLVKLNKGNRSVWKLRTKAIQKLQNLRQ
jgi:hypothetical protein